MTQKTFNLLIGGTSHTGKSTLAALVASATGCANLSTDDLARHPGRPWPTPAPHIEEYYASLSVETIHQLLLHNHANMWPSVKKMLSGHQKTEINFILEGSALRPEYLQTLTHPENLSVCLYANADFLRERIYRNASYEQLHSPSQRIVDKFVERSIIDNDANIDAANLHGITCVDVSIADAFDNLQRRLVTRMLSQ